jgi:hypothetical protein
LTEANFVDYPLRLMNILARVVEGELWELKVTDNKFHVQYDWIGNPSDTYFMCYFCDDISAENLENLEKRFLQLDEKAAETKRIHELSKSATAKLTKEEKEALGLTNTR